MDIRQLRYFIAIVEEKQISAAAERLHISQPPLSQHVKAMEEEIGSKLIERHGRKITVTQAGEALYKYALQITQLLEEAKKEVREIGNGVKGKLKLGINTFSSYELSTFLKNYHGKYPAITFSIQQNESSHLCHLVRERKIELAIIRLPLEIDDFNMIPLQEEPFYYVSSTEFHDCQVISLKDISEKPLILPSTAGLGIHYQILEAFSKLQITPNILAECSDITVMLKMVESGVAAAIVPETVVKQYKNYEINWKKVKESELTASTGLIWLKDHYLSKAARNFLALIDSNQWENFINSHSIYHG